MARKIVKFFGASATGKSITEKGRLELIKAQEKAGSKAGFEGIQQRTGMQFRRIQGGAGGYIPNFAMSPLDQAIGREKAAGLPINQIRINQDASLRNAGNPMGLAVTNTRDEPTGAIPAATGGGGDQAASVFVLKFEYMSQDATSEGLISTLTPTLV